MSRLKTRVIREPAELAEHFDSLASDYRDEHGDAGRLLAYRLGIIRRLMAGARHGTLLEIGCGTAIHLIPLAERFVSAIGADLSHEMIRVASRAAEGSPWRDRISLRVDMAEELATVQDRSVDVVLCVGALEHMWDQSRVVRQVRRVLRPGGRFVCLAPNGGYCWYRRLAPRLGLATRHLSTDQFLAGEELKALMAGAGLTAPDLQTWQFIPRGDIPRGWGPLLTALDWCGRRLGIDSLRGGIALCSFRPDLHGRELSG